MCNSYHRSPPPCLNQRYQALDELIQELCSARAGQDQDKSSELDYDDKSINMMCQFWNILKEEPDCDLKTEVSKRMGVDPSLDPSRSIKPSVNGFPSTSQGVACYTAELKLGKCSNQNSQSDVSPLAKALSGLKKASRYDPDCTEKLIQLGKTEEALKREVAVLEEKEREGVRMLKETDHLWTTMEKELKQKLNESQQRMETLNAQLKEVDANANKWRSTVTDLEFQIGNMNKCKREIEDKKKIRDNDVNILKMEVSNFKTRIANNQNDLQKLKSAIEDRKKASASKLADLKAQQAKLENKMQEERKKKHGQQNEGGKKIRDARAALTFACRELLQKKMQKEYMISEADMIQQEINLMKTAHAQCTEKCKIKEKNNDDEIAQLKKEIAQGVSKCLKCHQSTCASDIRRFCSDCPRCQNNIECKLVDGKSCVHDETQDCVCEVVKDKFLNNVFENMYTVLEKEGKTQAGKKVAQKVLNSLKNSRNGKVDKNTRELLKQFVLTGCKHYLPVTIIGGAVKTRCEMDDNMYEQLMACLNGIQEKDYSTTTKEEKGTDVKKAPCSRWEATSECHCPKGPKSCPCSSKAPKPSDEPASCPDYGEIEKLDNCPHKQQPCGPGCGINDDTDSTSTRKPASCSSKNLSFNKNPTAAQLILAPDTPILDGKDVNSRGFPMILEEVLCSCGPDTTKSCSCRGESKPLKSPSAKECNEILCSELWKRYESDFNVMIDTSGNEVIDELIKSKEKKRESHLIANAIPENVISDAIQLSDRKNKRDLKKIFDEDKVANYIQNDIKQILSDKTPEKADYNNIAAATLSNDRDNYEETDSDRKILGTKNTVPPRDGNTIATDTTFQSSSSEYFSGSSINKNPRQGNDIIYVPYQKPNSLTSYDLPNEAYCDCAESIFQMKIPPHCNCPEFQCNCNGVAPSRKRQNKSSENNKRKQTKKKSHHY